MESRLVSSGGVKYRFILHIISNVLLLNLIVERNCIYNKLLGTNSLKYHVIL